MNFAGLGVPVWPDVETMSDFKVGLAANGLLTGAAEVKNVENIVYTHAQNCSSFKT